MTSSRRRILVADEHVAIREGLRLLLGSHSPHWQIAAEAADGCEAVRLAEACRPDIAILGYALPKMNGVEVTRAIKNMLPRTEVLIFSRDGREELITEALLAGASGYALKSDSSEDLIKVVQALCVKKTWFSDNISEPLRHQLLAGKFEEIGSSLTSREREVVRLVAEGYESKQIGVALGISRKTVETHRTTVMTKLKLHTTAELVRYALRNNIIEP
jgi:DNA-binding NarL/FixJ family response regulator